MEEEAHLIRQQQRRLHPTILDVVKKEVTKLLAAGIIYLILESQWVSPVQVVPKKSGMTVMKNQHDKLVPMRIQNVLEKLAGKSHYCFLDGFSGYMVFQLLCRTTFRIMQNLGVECRLALGRDKSDMVSAETYPTPLD
ncbi:hypothetical protein CR513_20270, partial [Mucuna pruriens]